MKKLNYRMHLAQLFTNYWAIWSNNRTLVFSQRTLTAIPYGLPCSPGSSSFKPKALNSNPSIDTSYDIFTNHCHWVTNNIMYHFLHLRIGKYVQFKFKAAWKFYLNFLISYNFLNNLQKWIFLNNSSKINICRINF